MPQKFLSQAARVCVATALLCVPSVCAQTSLGTPGPVLRQFTDEAGRRVSVPVSPQRIISLAPAMTETLFALGVEDRIGGVTDFCDYPPAARKKPRIGGAINPNFEQIVALQPDLVLAQALTLNRRETVDALERLGLTVYATSASTVEGVLESTRLVGEVTGAGQRGEQLVTQLRERLGRLKQRLEGRPPRRVLFVVWHEPLISVGTETFLGDALRLAGAVPVVETEQDWPRLSLEEVVRQQPEYLVFASAHEQGVEHLLAGLKQRPGWRDLEAMKHHRVAIVSDAINRPAPRLVEAIEQLARQLHPEAFEEKEVTGSSQLGLRPMSSATATARNAGAGTSR